MLIKKYLITGMLVLGGLCLPIQGALALYSPVISQNVATIKSHILSSQAKNGTGTLLEAIKSIKSYNKVRREGGYASGISGEARVAQELILNQNYREVLQDPFASIWMVFNLNLYNKQFISNCLRNEIWGMEQLRDVVGQEMVKAYLMYDPVHGNLLKEDYLYIITEIDRLKKYGSDPNASIIAKDAKGKEIKMSSNQYFFNSPASDSGGTNMYTRKYFKSDLTGCPEGEFEKSFEQVARSWETLKTLGSGEGSFSFDGASWGSIWAMADANAKIRAKQWIQANQISLTLGEEEGANINSLVKGNGWDRFVGSAKTEIKIVENMVGLVTPLFDIKNWRTNGENKSGCVYYLKEENVYMDCQEYELKQWEQCKDDKTEAQKAGINCDRYRNLNAVRSLGEVAAEQLNLIENNEAAKKEATTAFTYSINLDSVAEQSIIEIDRELLLMNATIQQSYEGLGEKGGSSLPSLIKEVSHVTQNQCVNKQ